LFFWISSSASVSSKITLVPEDFRIQHPDVPWKLVAGLRDILIHGYFTVNLGRVWLVVKQDLPELEMQIAQIMDNLD
jgi:uncharacterized protein with HEPN domain